MNKDVAFHGWYRTGDEELAAKITFDGKTRDIEAQFLQYLKPKNEEGIKLVKQLVDWFNFGVDPEEVSEFMPEDAEQAIIPFEVEDSPKPQIDANTVELIEVIRGGEDGCLAVFHVQGERRCFEAEGLRDLAQQFSEHPDAPHWVQVADRIKSGYYLNTIDIPSQQLS